ncbi:stress responsive alpha/beta barrel protein [Neolewinella xylanilytica]|uniref:Stress responsive alpha/beta barrel protein n=1 Tax=Neolewinella xylanilytica TaxID=1514080 RepID=A0A2S6I0C8_9BACT|nr:Dabb family protein [Neolewinella xylanilytica]PPK84323.1 stress responsive alpha/beta barrel protein [Neolewinella xylanilytica]
MIYRTLLLPSALIIAFFLTACGGDQPENQSTNMDEMTDPGLAHTVYFWLQDSLTQADRASFEEGVRSLESSPSVRRLFLGKPAATPSRGVVDNSFDYTLILWFDDVAGHDAYQVSPVHLKFVEDHEAKFKEVRVYDHNSL